MSLSTLTGLVRRRGRYKRRLRVAALGSLVFAAAATICLLTSPQYCVQLLALQQLAVQIRRQRGKFLHRHLYLRSTCSRHDAHSSMHSYNAHIMFILHVQVMVHLLHCPF
jgi:hypothetical protein